MISVDNIEVTWWPPIKEGGMRTGSIPQGVMVAHSSGIAVAFSTEKAQYRNKDKCIETLEWILDNVEGESDDKI